MQSQVLRAIGNLGWERPTLWINDPLWVSLLDQGWPSLYDVTDDWVHAERSSRVHERIVKADRALIDGVDAVVVCSPELLVRKGGTLVRNGVDVAAYRRPADRPADLPAGPNAVYVGTLHEDRLDVDLTLATAARLARMGASLVLVGPDALASETSQRLRAASGLLVLGGRPAEQVPGYLQHAEVLVVPHVVDAFTDSLDPVKLYEYLAIGRPIVSTPVAGFRDAETARGIEVVGAEQFPDAVANLLRDPRPTVVHEGIPEWTDRAAQMRAVIQGISVRVAL
jgi:glycosyltransferase involved in cell wall biosynthesis